MTEQPITFTCDLAHVERLDRVIVLHMPDLSRSRIQALIRDGRIKVNGQVVTKTGANIEAGYEIEVDLPPVQPTGLVAEDIPLDVLFENDALLVINKPAGMVVHPAAGHASGTLVNAALAHAPEMEGIGGEQRPGIVHRLDKDTSGIIVIAKTDEAHHWLQDQFRLRQVHKTYLALVDGRPPTPEGRIEAPIGRDPSHRKRMAITKPEKGREAATEYHVIETFPNHALVEAHPITGRTHQIRLHMAFIGCPIAGDTLYGHRTPSVELNRHFLHAARLQITLPGESKPRTFEAPLPAELAEVLAQLRRE
ncbi:MAG TPA: RluA family pseudouridine synthase [Anaerolineaceae bacterium]|nr:RluA family pseudouridine synthase [Anaerolineaceae bacterium]HPN51621.1 RluA family pseudouridine synthase [Anaerolineaceae bacterium]